MTDVSDLGAALTMLRQGLVKAVVYVPLGFDQSIGNSTVATVYLDNTDPLSAASISGLMTQAAASISAQIHVSPPPDSVVTLDVANVYRDVLYIEFMAPGSLIQSIMFASIIGGGISILFDKQRGIIEGYLVTPLKQYEIVVGVLLAGVTKAMFSATAMLILAIIFAGVRPMTNVFGFVLIFFTLFLTSLGLISMMTTYAVRAPAPEVYQFTAFPINLILYFTSGAVYPIDGFPAWMRTMASVNPEAYADTRASSGHVQGRWSTRYNRRLRLPCPLHRNHDTPRDRSFQTSTVTYRGWLSEYRRRAVSCFHQTLYREVFVKSFPHFQEGVKCSPSKHFCVHC